MPDIVSVIKVPDDIYAYYPLAVGNKWEYKGWHKTCYGSCEKDDIITEPFDYTITIKSIEKNKDNVFEIKREICEGQNNHDYPGECRLSSNYLVGNRICRSVNCDYVDLSLPLLEEEVILDKEYKERMAAGIDDKMYVNFVRKKQTINVLGENNKNCFPIENFVLSSQETDIFCYGIGYVSYSYQHNGMVDDFKHELIKINFAKP